MNPIIYLGVLFAIAINLCGPSSLSAQVFDLEYGGSKYFRDAIKTARSDDVVQLQGDWHGEQPWFFGAPVMVFKGSVDEFGRIVMTPDWNGYFLYMGFARTRKKEPIRYRRSVPAILTMGKYADDLDVTEAQRDEVRTVVENYVSQRNQAGIDNPMNDDYQKVHAVIKEKYRDFHSQIFLKHQFARAEQIALQFNIDQFGLLAMLTYSEWSAKLEISDDQKDELKKSAQVLKAEMAQELIELQEKYDCKLLQVLTREQQMKAQKKLGVPIEGMVPDLMGSLYKLDFQPPGS